MIYVVFELRSQRVSISTFRIQRTIGGGTNSYRPNGDEPFGMFLNLCLSKRVRGKKNMPRTIVLSKIQLTRVGFAVSLRIHV